MYTMRQHHYETNILSYPCVMFWSSHNINGGKTIVQTCVNTIVKQTHCMSHVSCFGTAITSMAEKKCPNMHQHYCQTNAMYVPCVMFWNIHNINGRAKMCPNMRQHYCQTNTPLLSNKYTVCPMCHVWNNHNINGRTDMCPNMR